MKKSLGIAIALLWIIPLSVSADVLYSQSDDSMAQVSTNTSYTQTLGTGLSGTIGNIALYLGKRSGSPDLYLDFRLYCYNDSGYSSTCVPATDGLVARNEDFNTTLTTESKTLVTKSIYGSSGGVSTGLRYTLDPTKYYLLTVGSPVNTMLWGSASDVYAGGACIDTSGGGVNTCGDTFGTIADLFFVITDETGGDLTTHVSSVVPSAGSTTTSPVSVMITYYIAEQDEGKNFNLFAEIVNQNVDFSVTPLASLSSRTQLLNTWTSTTTGEYIFTTSVELENGNYLINAKIIEDRGWFSDEELSYVGHQFIVGSSTFLGYHNQLMLSNLAELKAAEVATSTAARLAACAPFSFNTLLCMHTLFADDPSNIRSQFTQVRDTLLHVWPIGYATRMVEIISNDTSEDCDGCLPYIIDTELPNNTPGAGIHLRLGFFDGLLGAGTILSEAENPNTGDTLREIVEPGWRLFVYAGFGVMLMLKVLGMTSMLRGMEQAGNTRGERQRYMGNVRGITMRDI